MQPSILSASATAGQEEALRSWLRFGAHIRSVLSGPEVARATRPAADPICFWRLVAANHRELARGYELFPSAVSLRSSLRRLQRRTGELAVVTLHGAEPQSHGWYAMLAGVPVMTCSRWYGGNAAALIAAQGAIEALSVARRDDEVHPIEWRSAVSPLLAAEAPSAR